jgi:hypothetical protein
MSLVNPVAVIWNEPDSIVQSTFGAADGAGGG